MSKLEEIQTEFVKIFVKTIKCFCRSHRDWFKKEELPIGGNRIADELFVKDKKGFLIFNENYEIKNLSCFTMDDLFGFLKLLVPFEFNCENMKSVVMSVNKYAYLIVDITIRFYNSHVDVYDKTNFPFFNEKIAPELFYFDKNGKISFNQEYRPLELAKYSLDDFLEYLHFLSTYDKYGIIKKITKDNIDDLVIVDAIVDCQEMCRYLDHGRYYLGDHKDINNLMNTPMADKMEQLKKYSELSAYGSYRSALVFNLKYGNVFKNDEKIIFNLKTENEKLQTENEHLTCSLATMQSIVKSLLSEISTLKLESST